MTNETESDRKANRCGHHYLPKDCPEPECGFRDAANRIESLQIERDMARQSLDDLLAGVERVAMIERWSPQWNRMENDLPPYIEVLYGAWLNGKKTLEETAPIKLIDLHVVPGKADAAYAVDPELAMAMLSDMTALFEQSGANNYLEYTLRSRQSDKEFAVLIQKKNGKTPAEKLSEAIRSIEESKAKCIEPWTVAELDTLLAKLKPSGVTPV